MKKITYKTGIILALLTLLASCNTWLDKPPLTSYLDDPSYWDSETSVRLFANGFYSLFNGAGNNTTMSSTFVNTGTGNEADIYFASFSDDQTPIATSTPNEPFGSGGFNMFPPNAMPTANTWSTPYTFIRLAQLLLARIDEVPSTNITDAAKSHYKGMAYFFLAMEYFDLVRHYGDVPYVDKYLDQTADTTIMWGPRVNRDAVMDNVLADINQAIAMLYTKSVADADQNLGANTVNQDCANLLKSRICLYEGTYAKYHENNMQRATQYLTECKTASEAVMNSGNYALFPDYKTAYDSPNLSTGKGGEILLYRKYSAGIKPSLVNQIYTWANSTTGGSGLTKDAVESFLCTDGLPISLSPLYQGDVPTTTLSIANSVLANRDKRLIESVDTVLGCTGPAANKPKGIMTTSGYLITRFNPPTGSTVTLTDEPVYWYPEVLLNEAEALVELGSFQQADADKTINLLRARAGVAKLDVSNVPDDPKRDPDVSPLLWEVRRERRAELMLTTFRYWDIRRWEKIGYLDPNMKPDIFLGAKLPTGKVFPGGGGLDPDRYIIVFPAATAVNRVVSDRDYLDYVPTEQIQLYTAKGITFPQNPGW